MIAIADRQSGVVSRRQAYDAGVTRWQVRAETRALRWKVVGTQCLAVHTGPLPREAELWAAVLEAGPRAHLDGVAALEVAGLKNFEEPLIRVSVPRGARVRRTAGVAIRQTRRYRSDDVVAAGIPRTRPEVAATRAALWAVTDRRAALILTMAVQQRIVTADALGRAMLRVRRDRRRAFVHGILLDLLGGAGSLGEIDFVRQCRERGLPAPAQQVVRRAPSGRYYLDVCWPEFRLVVEVDGIHHLAAEHVVGDALRQNDVVIRTDETVLRLPLLGLKVAADEFFEQIAEALRLRGWTPGRSEAA